MYEYRAKLLHVVDADTLDLEVDLGFGILRHDRFRLVGINAPEKNTASGKAAIAFVNEKLDKALNDKAYLVVRTEKDSREKFGRYLAHVILPSGKDLAELLLDQGMAVEYSGGKRV